MKNSKHTPGPWELSDCGERVIGQADQDEIHEVANLTNTLNHEANARLIAAAPELLEALRELAVQLTEQNSTGSLKLNLKVSRALAASVGVIDKAEGRE
jgi:hypothetical protein